MTASALYWIYDVATAATAARLPRGAVVKLAVPSLDPCLAEHFELRINASLAECGCHLSALFLILTVGAIAMANVLQWSVIRQAPIAAAIIELSFAFIMSGIGRMTGIVRARWTLRKKLSELSNLILETNK